MPELHFTQLEVLKKVKAFKEITDVDINDALIKTLKEDQNILLYTTRNLDDIFKEVENQILEPRFSLKKLKGFNRLFVDKRIYTLGVPINEPIIPNTTRPIYRPVKSIYRPLKR